MYKPYRKIFFTQITAFFEYHDNDWVGLQPHVAKSNLI